MSVLRKIFIFARADNNMQGGMVKGSVTKSEILPLSVDIYYSGNIILFTKIYNFEKMTRQMKQLNLFDRRYCLLNKNTDEGNRNSRFIDKFCQICSVTLFSSIAKTWSLIHPDFSLQKNQKSVNWDFSHWSPFTIRNHIFSYKLIVL